MLGGSESTQDSPARATATIKLEVLIAGKRNVLCGKEVSETEAERGKKIDKISWQRKILQEVCFTTRPEDAILHQRRAHADPALALNSPLQITMFTGNK